MAKVKWKHIKTIADGQRFELQGLNIWDFKWQSEGEFVFVQDPQYGQTYHMEVFKIVRDRITVRFAAGEFSNCIWGIYQEIQDGPFRWWSRGG